MHHHQQGQSLVAIQLVIIFAMLFLAGSGILSLNVMEKSAYRMGQGKDVVADILPPPLYLIESQLTVNDLLRSESSERHGLILKLQNLKKDYDQRNDFWSASDLDAGLKQALFGDQHQYADLYWKESQSQFIPAIEAGDMEAAHQSAKRLHQYYLSHRDGVDATVKIANQFADGKLKALEKTYWTMGAIITLAMLVAILAAIPSLRRVIAHLKAVGVSVGAIADGNLTHEIPSASEDEIGALIKKVVLMRNNLLDLIRELHTEIEILNRHSAELSQEAKSGTHLAESQSEATSSMAAAVEQLSVSLDQVEAYAVEARQVTQESAKQALASSKVIEHTASEMEVIAEVVGQAANNISNLEGISVEIFSIVQVIRDVAEQTNLLALNAAIEAARAGEAGRGFAVVADEVRKLAERTSTSSGEITAMIERIQLAARAAVSAMEQGVTRVAAGVELARGASSSVTDIRNSQAEATQSVDDISMALKEQASATRSIAGQVEKVSQGTEELAVTARKNQHEAKELADLSQHIEALTKRFKVS